MRYLAEHFRNWHFDIPTLLVTLLFIPIAIYLIGILRRHGKAWAGYAVEGVCYGIGRFVVHSLAARFTLKRYCRLQLQKDNQYLFVPSRSDVKLEIDNVFVNLTLEEQMGTTEQFNQNSLLSAGNRIRVIGDPGSGKSSLVKRVFRDTCTIAIARPSKAKLPILVELRSFTIPKTTTEQNLGDWFYGYLKETAKKSDVYGMEECFENYARVSGLLVLLDGLDEVASAGYERVQAAIIGLSEKLANLNHENVIVLTMRTQLHQQIRDAFRRTFGKALFVKPFSPTDVYEFLSRWPFSNRQVGPAIYSELTDRPTLREMCTNPLVLAMYVAARQSASDPITPESRTDFYRGVLDELLVKRRARQVGPTPATGKLREQRERILGRLAYDHILDSTQPANSLNWENAIRIVGGVMACDKQRAEEVFLEIAKDTGLISQERERESFRFIHLTFCEFLAAREAVEGQKNGLRRLIETHSEFRAKPGLQGPSRLLEVIPFSCGLVQRVHREDVMTEIAALCDDRLLARCFLETKAYEHKSWKAFAQRARDNLLNTADSDWDEKWLQDLHLFNVVVRDAAQCSVHVPGAAEQIDLGDFYQILIGRQTGKSLATLLTAYASHDAPAAFRLAEVSGLDLALDFPEVIVANCDQRPFLSLITNKVVAEPSKAMSWSVPLAEAGLSSRLVARSLLDEPPNRDAIRAHIEGLSQKHRWNAAGLTSESLYTQIITLAVASIASSKHPAHLFPRLRIVCQASAPGSLTWARFAYNRRTTFLVAPLFLSSYSFLLYVFLGLGFHIYTHAGSPYRLHTVLLATLIATLSYGVVLRGSAFRRFYAALLNISDAPFPNRETRLSVSDAPLTANPRRMLIGAPSRGDALRIVRQVLSFVPLFPPFDFYRQIHSFFLLPRERKLLRDIGQLNFHPTRDAPTGRTIATSTHV